MKLTDLPKEAMNQIVNRLPAANQVRLAAVSKELHRRVNRVQGPISAHPSHDTLRQPDIKLITHVAQRFEDLRDFLRVCAANVPPNFSVIESTSDNSNSEFGSNDTSLKTQLRMEAKAVRFAEWFTELWQTHSKVPSRDAHLSSSWDDNDVATIRVNCGSTYYFVLDIMLDGRDRLYVKDFRFENHDGRLKLLGSVPLRLDTYFEESFTANFNPPLMTVSIKPLPGRKIRDCARLVLVFNKVSILLYNAPIHIIRVGNPGAYWNDYQTALIKILIHNGFHAIATQYI